MRGLPRDRNAVGRPIRGPLRGFASLGLTQATGSAGGFDFIYSLLITNRFTSFCLAAPTGLSFQPKSILIIISRSIAVSIGFAVLVFEGIGHIAIFVVTRHIIGADANAVGVHGQHGIQAAEVYGGAPMDRQILRLKTANLVVGTPGRVMDHMRRGTLKLDRLKMIVLDEADEMLSMGFREDIETILKDVPQERQTILFSATMSPEIMRITKQYQTDPELIRITREQLTVPNIEQTYYEVPVGKKTEVLSRLLDVYNPSRSIVFCNTKKQVDELVEELHARGYQARGLHGDMKQGERTQIMNGFRRGSIDILVATDVAARGIDVEDIAAVFNYDIPQDVEYYVHRIGRTGRIGKEGRAFTFVTGRRQIYELRDIERFTKSKITLKAVPSSSEVNETNERKFLDRVRVVLEEGGLEEYTPYTDALLEDYASLDISAALIKMLLKKEQRGRRPSRADDELFAAESRRNRMERDPRRRERGDRKSVV